MLSPSIITTALRWIRHAQAAGARFDVEAKAAGALAFCDRRGAHSFALPSALDGTKRRQSALAEMADVLDAYDGRPVLLRLSVCRIGEGSGRPHIIVSTPRGPLGRLRRKHTAWALPLLPYGLAAYALQVTGGTPDKPTRGCNIALAHIAAALDALEQAPGRPATPRHPAPIVWSRSPATA